MNDATVTEESSAPDEATGNENNSNGDSPQTAPNTGLLASAGTEDETPAPETSDPDTTPEPGTIAERPTYIAEQFWDKQAGTLKDEALANSYNELRKEFNKLSQGKEAQEEKAPGDPKDYLKDFKPPHRTRPGEGQKEGELLDQYKNIQPDDPFFVAMSKAAKNSNLSKGQFDDMMQDVMEELHKTLPEPFNSEKELALLGEGGEKMVKTNSTWVNHLHKNGVLNEAQFNHLISVGNTALGVEVVNKLRINSGEKPIPVNASVNSGQKTPDECRAMVADKRYKEDGPAGDAYRKTVDAAFAETFGTNPA